MSLLEMRSGRFCETWKMFQQFAKNQVIQKSFWWSAKTYCRQSLPFGIRAIRNLCSTWIGITGSIISKMLRVWQNLRSIVKLLRQQILTKMQVNKAPHSSKEIYSLRENTQMSCKQLMLQRYYFVISSLIACGMLFRSPMNSSWQADVPLFVIQPNMQFLG